MGSYQNPNGIDTRSEGEKHGKQQIPGYGDDPFLTSSGRRHGGLFTVARLIAKAGDPEGKGWGTAMLNNLEDGLWGTETQPGVLGFGQYGANDAFGGQGFGFDPVTGEMGGTDAYERMYTREANRVQGREGDYMGGQAQAMNQAAQQYFMGQQNNIMQQYLDQAAGKGDSLAQMQLQKSSDANLRNQLAMAGAQRGLGRGAALQQLNAQGAQAGQQLAADSGMLRLNEQMQARQAAANMAQGGFNSAMGARGQDLQYANDRASQYLGNRGQNDAMTQFYLGQNQNMLTNNANNRVTTQGQMADYSAKMEETKRQAYEDARKGNDIFAKIGKFFGGGGS